MSGTFTPVVLNKETTRTAFKTVASAIVSSPVAVVLGLAVAIVLSLIMGWLWLLPREGNVAASVVGAMLFMFLTINAPPLLGSYLMYKVAYRQSLFDFIHNLSATRYGRHFIYSQIANLVIFTILFSVVNFMSSPGEAQSNADRPEGGFALVILAFNLVMMLIALFFWLKMVNEQSIIMRTGFGEAQAVHYGQQARRMNKKGVKWTFAMMLLLIIVIVMLTSSFGLASLLFFMVMLISAMVWIYVLFGNTFPPKEPAKSTVLKPITPHS